MKRRKLFWQIYFSFLLFTLSIVTFIAFASQWKWTGTALALIFSAILAYFLSKRLGRPLEDLSRQARRYSDGDFTQKIGISEDAPQEIRTLADSLNVMALSLGQKILTIEEKHLELQSILGSMQEAVITVDQDGRILHLNLAAKDLFKLTPGQSQGKLLQEVVRVRAIQDLFQKILNDQWPLEEQLILNGPDNRPLYVRAHGRLLFSPQGTQLGAMVILHDESKLYVLENHRKEFVANVSHELRTPLTTIKGLMEILRDGPTSADETMQFYETIIKNVERLNALVEDLLSLAQLDQEEIKRELPLETVPLRPVLEKAHQICALKLSRKGMSFKLDCAPELKVMVNASLLEMAVINLLDNAAKYGDAGTEVHLFLEEGPKELFLCVANQGRPIPKEMEERIFERFYRIDKSRPVGDEGGTGLGLSIVKHVALVHRGTVGVRSSAEAKGPIFWLSLPWAGRS